MPRGNSRAAAILASARESMAIAESDVEQARALLEKTEAVLSAYKRIYFDIERTLAAPRGPKSQPAPAAATRSPRKSKKDSLTANSGTAKETISPVGACADCGQESQYAIHSETSLTGYHPFQKKKRRRNQDPPIVLPDSPEDAKEMVSGYRAATAGGQQ